MRFLTGLVARPSASILALLVALCPVTSGILRGQDALNPSDIWYRGFLLIQGANELETQGDYLGALNKLGEAKPLFDHLSQQFPEFQAEIVSERRRLIAEKRDELKQKMRNPVPHSVAGQGGIPGHGTPVAPPPIETYTASSRSMEIEEESSDVVLPSWNNGESRVVTQVAPVAGMPRVQSGQPEGYTAGKYANEVYDDLARKDQLIGWLNDENLKLKRQLQDRENLLRQVNQELSTAQASRLELMDQIRRTEGQGGVQAEQKITQLKELLREATDQLEKATQRNSELVAELGQSQQEVSRLRSRMAELEKERDNLLEVVRGEGNGGSALKELMDRNRQLTEQLNRAEQLATSLSELNKEKDTDIAMLKSEIAKIRMERDSLFAENQRHQQNIDELTRKLELLSDGLTAEEKDSLSQASAVERQENELLRSIVLKQLRRQAQMKQAKELLLAQLDKVGARSDTLLGLVEDMARGSQLSEEEKALFKAPALKEIVEATLEPGTPADTATVDDAARMSATMVVAANTPVAEGTVREQKAAAELTQLEKAARLDFSEGRLADAEAGFQEYLRFRPRSVACLCNLGVLKIAMKNYTEAEHYLERAIAIDAKSGLANYLLGRVYFLQDRLDDSLAKLEASITYDPQNAKAHNCVGVISSRKGWVERAQRAFINAVSIDPEYGDAHFNLAVLFATKEQPEPQSAEKHYFRALHLGVPRDASIEQFLKEAEEAGVSVGMR